MYSDVVAALKTMINDYVNRIHTALPAEIVSVDTKTGFATVQPIAKMTVGNQSVDFPEIANVPIVFPYSSSSGAAIAFPVSKGDQCLIVFSEQATDYWLDKGTIADGLKYDLSNAICIPGLMKTVSSDFADAVNNNSVIISNGNNKIMLSNSAITIRGDVIMEGNLTINGTINKS